ncbi:MAG TPA: hypothetical protein VKS21_13700, partial [Spirochaetota bacterium]|nr:hypothetical protein [Spirochaetota bacterium]
ENSIDSVTSLKLIISNTQLNTAVTNNLLSTLSNSNWSLNFDTTAYADDYYNFRLFASNRAGLFSSVLASNILISNALGDICFVSPTNNEYTSGVTTMTGYVAAASLAPVSYFISNQATTGWSLLAGSDTNFQTTLDTALLSDGVQQIAVLYTNMLGYSNTGFITVTVDNSPPEATLITPFSSNVLNGNRIFSGTAADPHTPLSGGLLILSNLTSGATSHYSLIHSNGSWTNQLDTTLLADGIYTAVISVTNKAGLSTNSTAVTFFIVNHTPVIELTNIANLIKGTYAVNNTNVKLYGLVSNISSNLPAPGVYLSYAGNTNSAISNLSGKNFSFTLDSTMLSQGLFNGQLSVEIPDTGISMATNFSFIVEKSAPQIFINSSRDSSSMVSLNGSNYDPQSGVTNSRLIISNLETGAVSNLLVSLSSPLWSLDFDSAAYENGDYMLVLNSVNQAGMSNVTSIPLNIVNLTFAPQLGPNPYRADSASADGILFTGLTQSTFIKIYSVNGRPVKTITAADIRSSGREPGYFSWNTRNENGNETAPGIYLVYLYESKESSPVILKLTIQK